MDSRQTAEETGELKAKATSRAQRRSSFSSVRSSMRVLRTLSIGSQLSNASDANQSSVSARKKSTLRKIVPPEFTKQQLARHPSKASSEDYTERTSDSTRPTTPSGSGSQNASLFGDAVSILKSGPLLEDVSMLKTRTRYLVLTSVSICKFKSRMAAVDQFPQLSFPTSAAEALSPVDSFGSFRDMSLGAEMQIPLEKIITVFRDEGTKPSFGLEIWWKDPGPAHPVAHLELDFALPEDRDEWLKQIKQAIKHRTRASIDEQALPIVEIDLMQLLEAKYPQQDHAHFDVFPVVPRRPFTQARSNPAEVRRGWRDGLTFYLAFTKNICLLAVFTKPLSAGKAGPTLTEFGLATLCKVNASMNDERFDLIFRLPLEAPQRLELSSRHHRQIIGRLFKADTYLKPAWPLWTRREVFFIEGLSEQIPLTEGEDYGCFKRTLEAFLDGYRAPAVNWTVNWKNSKYPPEFQLLPLPSGLYTSHQLLAVFRALRFNDFFKSLSFRGIDFSTLSWLNDNIYRLEPTAWLSRTGKRSLTRDEFEIIERSTVLSQEIVALLLGSESVRHIDLQGVLPNSSMQGTSTSPEAPPLPSHGCEVVPPLILLLRSLQTRCKSLNLSGNPLDVVDVSEFYQTLQARQGVMRGLSFSHCRLDEMAMISLWEGIHEQRESLETLEFANNYGLLEATRVSQTVRDASKLRKLDLSHCLRGNLDGPLFRPWTTSPYSDPWRLEEINLSGWKINFDTISSLLRYLELEESKCLRQLVLNNCGISGEVATAIFCRIGKGRDVHLHLNSNPLEEGSIDWIDLIHGDEAPKKLHLDMVQFRHESSFNRLLTALTHNTTVEYLSLVGTGPPDRVSSKTSELLSKLFESNSTLKFLDLSGYSGKLEDVHLGWGLSGALSGLKQNQSLRQVRIRNHEIGAAEDISELCRVIATNENLSMLDLQYNNFDHHQFAQLVQALMHNHQIVSFPISTGDREYALAKEKSLFMKTLKRPTKALHKPLSKSDEGRLDRSLKWLEGHWDSEAKNVREVLCRNRMNPVNQGVEFDPEALDSWEDETLQGWVTAHPSSGGKGKERERSTSFNSITRSESFASISSQNSLPPISGHSPSFSQEWPFVSSDPPMQTYTIEEEASPSDYDQSPLNKVSSEELATPLASGQASASAETPKAWKQYFAKK